MVALPGPGLYNRPLIEATRYSFTLRLPAAYRAEVDAHRIPLAAHVHTGRWPVLPERPRQFAARQQTGLELLGPPRRWGGRIHQREARPDLSTTRCPHDWIRSAAFDNRRCDRFDHAARLRWRRTSEGDQIMTDTNGTRARPVPPPASRRRVHLRAAGLHPRQRPGRTAAPRPGAGIGRRQEPPTPERDRTPGPAPF